MEYTIRPQKVSSTSRAGVKKGRLAEKVKQIYYWIVNLCICQKIVDGSLQVNLAKCHDLWGKAMKTCCNERFWYKTDNDFYDQVQKITSLHFPKIKDLHRGQLDYFTMGLCVQIAQTDTPAQDRDRTHAVRGEVIANRTL